MLQHHDFSDEYSKIPTIRRKTAYSRYHNNKNYISLT